MTSHLCKDGAWKQGKAATCSEHARNRNRQEVRMGKKERTSMDRAAGVIGTDRGGFISAKEGK